jgi:hypothetical protein
MPQTDIVTETRAEASVTPAPVVPQLHVGSGLLLLLFVIGCVATFFKALIGSMPMTAKETWGRIGLGGVLSMAAAATPLIFTGASPEAQCGIAAALAIVGDALAVKWLKSKLGV